MPKHLSIKESYGDSLGPLGFPLPSETAKAIEKLMKTVSAEIKKLFHTEVDGEIVEGYCRRFHVTKSPEFTPGERAEISFVSTRAIDRDSEVIMPNGLDWKHFRKNPIVPFSHNYRELPVGRSLWVVRAKDDDRTKDGWKAKTEYFTKPKDWSGPWLPDAIWHIMTEGKMPLGKSIGFVPMEGHSPKPQDLKDDPMMADVHFIITKALVLEYSATPLPSNQTALPTAIAAAAKAGCGIPETVLKSMGVVIPESMYGTDDEGTTDVLPPEVVKPSRDYETVKAEARCAMVKRINGLPVENVLEGAVRRMKGKL